ncbi:MAG: deoxyribodipyrimidine photo-lyase [Acidobacteria bacterium]|nr:deoxyribodipyrimidine photo-lyase [Acidobacteriota bacterium]
MSGSTLVWFRHDFRLADNPALAAATARGGPVVPVFLWEPAEEGDWPAGGASKWWLHQSLERLDADLRALGSRLILRQGPAAETLAALARETGAEAVYWNRRYEPASIERDQGVKQSLRSEGLDCRSFSAALLWEPWTIRTQSGGPYKVFSPFWRACQAAEPPGEPEPAPTSLPSPAIWPCSVQLAALGLEPAIDWAAGIREAWRPGEAGAAERLSRFVEEIVDDYAESRDRPDRDGTSRLSPHLHFGEISPRTIWRAVRERLDRQEPPRGAVAKSAQKYLAELAWREFGHHLLYHFPHTPLEPLRPEFARFPWADDPENLRRWQKGRTGYPIVDAGMRELWATGWMHNRVRMIVASFLVKDLLLPWQEGARWFWDTLVDADLANNTLGWQWAGGCGADAAPYFRIFNPILQGERFDPRGVYVRRWVPELAAVPDRWLHKPWEAPMKVLRGCGVNPATDYPLPSVNHSEARQRALEAWDELKSQPDA